MSLKNSSLRSWRLCGSIRTVVTFENSFHPLKFRFEIILLLLIALATAILQWPYLFEFPGHIHAWAQVDRLALTNGFLRNGFDLFHPETQVLNHIYPHDFFDQSASTITAVDLPLHDYLVAIIMRLFGCSEAWVFRLYVIAAGIIGLFYLGKLSLLVLKDEVKAFMVLAFACLSPVFVYYQGSLLPSIPSLSLIIAGVYYYFRFREHRKSRDFMITMCCMALALLSRTTFVIPFVAVLCLEFLDVIKNRKIPWKRVAAVFVVAIAFFAYRHHNDALRNEYGSMFLNRLLPAESMEEVKFLLGYVWEHWRFSYFSSIHYWAVLILLVSVGVVRFAKWSKEQPLSRFGLYVLTYFIGCFLFAAAMLKQFQYHDYYFLDTFYLPCVLLVLLLLAYLPSGRSRWMSVVYMAVLIVFVSAAFRMPQRSQRSRHQMGVNDRTQNTIENFTGADVFLDELGVSRDAIVLVVDAVAPNLPHTLMDRKGLVVMYTPKWMVEHAFNTWTFDYVVFQNEYFMDNVYRGYPEILSRVRVVGSNGRITVCRRDEGNQQTLQEFLGIGNEATLIDERMGFEDADSARWRGYQLTRDAVFEGKGAACCTPDYSSGLTMEWEGLQNAGDGYHAAWVSMQVRSSDVINADVVLWMSVDGKEVYNEMRPLKDFIKPDSAWQRVDLSFVLPPLHRPNTKLSCYLTNREPSLLYYDNFHFSIFP